MATPTNEQVEKLRVLLNKLNMSTQSHDVGDLVAALFERVAQLETKVATLEAAAG